MRIAHVRPACVFDRAGVAWIDRATIARSGSENAVVPSATGRTNGALVSAWSGAVGTQYAPEPRTNRDDTSEEAMKKTTRIESAVCGLGIFLGGVLVTSSALACPHCPDGYVETSVSEGFPFGQGLVFADGGQASSPANQNDPDAPAVLDVNLIGGAWCVAAFATDWSCYVETSSGDPVFGNSTESCSSARENTNYVAFAMYCRPQ
jgi:hypothetical protein